MLDTPCSRGSVKSTGYPLHSPVHLNRPVGRQFSRLQTAEVCASAVLMLDTPCSRGSVKSTGYTLHSPVSPSLPRQCVTVCQYISTGVHHFTATKIPTTDHVIGKPTGVMARDGYAVQHCNLSEHLLQTKKCS